MWHDWGGAVKAMLIYHNWFQLAVILTNERPQAANLPSTFPAMRGGLPPLLAPYGALDWIPTDRKIYCWRFIMAFEGTSAECRSCHIPAEKKVRLPQTSVHGKWSYIMRLSCMSSSCWLVERHVFWEWSSLARRQLATTIIPHASRAVSVDTVPRKVLQKLRRYCTSVWRRAVQSQNFHFCDSGFSRFGPHHESWRRVQVRLYQQRLRESSEPPDWVAYTVKDTVRLRMALIMWAMTDKSLPVGGQIVHCFRTLDLLLFHIWRSERQYNLDYRDQNLEHTYHNQAKFVDDWFTRRTQIYLHGERGVKKYAVIA